MKRSRVGMALLGLVALACGRGPLGSDAAEADGGPIADASHAGGDARSADSGAGGDAAVRGDAARPRLDAGGPRDAGAGDAAWWADLPDAAPEPAEGCTDIWLSELSFDDPERWRPDIIDRFPWKPFARDERGVHVAYHALQRPPGEPITEPGNQQAGALVVFTFDPETGQPTTQRMYDVFHESDGPMSRAVIDFALAPDGTFAVLLAGAVRGGGTSKVMFGHLDDPARQWMWSDPWPEEGPSSVSWDGEAFAIHGGGRRWVVARVDTDGETILARRDVGLPLIAPPNTRRELTNPASGRSYLMRAGGHDWETREPTAFWLNVHDREGNPLFGTGEQPLRFGRLTPREEFQDEFTDRLEFSLVEHGGRLWFAGNVYASSRGRALNRDIVVALRPTMDGFDSWRVWLPADEVGPQPEDLNHPLLVSAPDEEYPWLVINTWQGVELFRFDETGVRDRRVVVGDEGQYCSSRGTCDEMGWGPVHKQVYRWRDELWLGIGSNGCVQGPPDRESLAQCVRYRIVKLDLRCRYRSIGDYVRDRLIGRRRR